MYFPPANPLSSPRIIGATIAGMVTAATIYAVSASLVGFGHHLPRPIDFVSTTSSGAYDRAEPETVMVPDTSIPAMQMSDEPTSNLVREGPASNRIRTLLPAAGDGQSGWTFSSRPRFAMSGQGVVEPTLKSTASAGFPQLPALAQKAGVTTMSYCVTSDGRVRDAKVSASSGYNQLDAAALDWLNARSFASGTVKGAPTEMCGLIDYQWRIDGAK